MTVQSVVIKELAMYHPKRKVTNKETLKHFTSIGQDEQEVEKFLKKLAKKTDISLRMEKLHYLWP
ncbi:hypothetical protein P4V11_18390 [Bacillus subtilis]|nr:hypothetical protein [Bacillus subtilis]